MASTKSEIDQRDSIESAALDHHVKLGELSVEFVTHDSSLHSWLASYYERAEHHDQRSSYKVQFEAIGSPFELDVQIPEEGLFTKFCLVADSHCYFANGKFYSSAEGDYAHEIELDVINRTVRANLGGLFLSSVETFIYVVVRDILRRLVLPLSGILMLHGSVVTHQNQTIYFAGDKGMGKSTIALEMLRHGYKIASDDSPLAALTTGGVVVFSGRDQLSVTANTLNLFPELNEFLSIQRDVSGKYFLDRTRMSSLRIDSDPRRISHFIQLKRENSCTLSLNKTSKTAATAEFVREFMPIFRKEIQVEQDPAFFKRVNGTMFQILSALFASAQTYELIYSNEHREQIPGLLKALGGAA